MSGCRSEARRLFQILGPATKKLLSPSVINIVILLGHSVPTFVNVNKVYHI